MIVEVINNHLLDLSELKYSSPSFRISTLWSYGDSHCISGALGFPSPSSKSFPTPEFHFPKTQNLISFPCSRGTCHSRLDPTSGVAYLV